MSVLRLGTRGSELALWQARHVASLLGERGIQTELVIVQTSGDRDRSRALHELPGVGFFTKELQQALLEDRVDLVVHSLKDLPTEEPAGLALAAILDREDPSELLLARTEALGNGRLGLRPGAVIGTSSLRRAAQALALQPDLVIRPLRGNVPTRLRKVREGEYDAILVANAGVTRLQADLSGLEPRVLDIDLFLPAPGQGALAIEIRATDECARAAVGPLDQPAVATETGCERELLKRLGGGCHLPLGARARQLDGAIELHAVLGELDDRITRASVRRARVRASSGPEAALAALAALRAEQPA